MTSPCAMSRPWTSAAAWPRSRPAPPENLSRFNLDLHGLTVGSIAVDGQPARFSRLVGELTIVPANGLLEGRTFTTVVQYGGVPQTSDTFHITVPDGLEAVANGLPDITVPSGPGSTLFEADGDVLDGWLATGPPTASPDLANNWTTGPALAGLQRT